MRPFRQLLIADLSGNLDLELLRHGARITARAATGSLLVLTPEGACMLRSFASVVQRTFAAERAVEPMYRVLPEPDLQILMSMVQDSSADIMIVKYSGQDMESCRLARRLVREAPCSVWLQPARDGGSFTRAVTVFNPGETGAAVLETTARVCKAVGVTDLSTVHLWLASAKLHEGDEAHRRLADRQEAKARRFLETVDMHGLRWGLTVKDAPPTPKTLLRLAQEQCADLVVIPAPELTRTGHALQRDGIDLYLKANLPLLCLRVPANGKNRRGLWRDLFSLSEPVFN